MSITNLHRYPRLAAATQIVALLAVFHGVVATTPAVPAADPAVPRVPSAVHAQP